MYNPRQISQEWLPNLSSVVREAQICSIVFKELKALIEVQSKEIMVAQLGDSLTLEMIMRKAHKKSRKSRR